MPYPSDTSPHAQRLVIEGYRRMSPADKIGRVVALNRALEELASARLRSQYGNQLPEDELRLRLAALRLDPKTQVGRLVHLYRDALGMDQARLTNLANLGNTQTVSAICIIKVMEVASATGPRESVVLSLTHPQPIAEGEEMTAGTGRRRR